VTTRLASVVDPCSKLSKSPILIGEPAAVRLVNVSSSRLTGPASLNTRMKGSEVEELSAVPGV